MPRPSKQEVAVAIDALWIDAESWKSAAVDMGKSAAAARGLGLDTFHFSYIGEMVGIVSTYQQLQEKLARLTGEAATYFDDLAEALRQAAREYAGDDAANAHALRNVY